MMTIIIREKKNEKKKEVKGKSVAFVSQSLIRPVFERVTLNLLFFEGISFNSQSFHLTQTPDNISIVCHSAMNQRKILSIDA